MQIDRQEINRALLRGYYVMVAFDGEAILLVQVVYADEERGFCTIWPAIGNKRYKRKIFGKVEITLERNFKRILSREAMEKE